LPAPEGTAPRWVKELIEECAAFPNGATDDQVDAMTQALVRMASAGGRAEVRTGRVDPARLFDR
jgi:phage terminase large subunit-like protein